MRLFLPLAVLGCTSEPPTTADTAEVVVAPPNRPPVVDIRDVTLFEGESATLEPTVSDPDGDPLTFRWQFRLVPPLSRVRFEDPTAASVSFTPDRLGAYLVEVVVSDAEYSTHATAVVSVLSDAERPIAYGGEDRVVGVGRSVELNGSASKDLFGRYLFFEWSLADAPAASTATLQSADASTTFVPDVEGAYTVALTVHNGSRASVADEVIIEALPDAVTPGDVPSAAFLPEQAYIIGFFDNDFCTLAVAHWSDLDTLVGGIDQCDVGLSVAPQFTHDGRLVYLVNGGLYQFVCDGCPDWVQGTPLPTSMNSNDVALDTAPCDGITHALPLDFREGADGRRLLYCDGEWRDDQDRVVKNARNWPIAYSGDVALDQASQLLHFDTGQLEAVKGGPGAFSFYAARAVKGGFWVVTTTDELWFVDSSTAAATLVYEYGSIPLVNFAAYDHAIDQDGTLVQRVLNGNENRMEIWRRRLDGVVDRMETLDKPFPWMTSAAYVRTSP